MTLLPESGRRTLAAVLSLAAILTAALDPAPAAADYKKAQKAQFATLEQKYQDWLADVEQLIGDEELETFLVLEKDYQRDAFIDQFWLERDPYPDTARNEFKQRWYEMIDYARSRFGSMSEDRSRLLLKNGPPGSIYEAKDCRVLHPLEVWFYAGSFQVGFRFALVFYRPNGLGKYRLWYPSDGLAELFDTNFVGGSGQVSLDSIRFSCTDGESLAGAIGWVMAQGQTGFPLLLSRIDGKPEPPETEWVATFNSYSTDLPEDAGTFHTSLEIAYPGRQQNRTVTQGIFKVATGEIGLGDLEGHRSYNLLLTGEVLRDGELFDTFRYKFDFAESQTPEDALPMVFQRTLRPGEYRMIVKLEDLNSGRFYREEKLLEVPKLEKEMPPPEPEDPETARLLREANAAINTGDTTISLIEPTGELHSGLMRVETLTTGQAFEKATFFLDDKPVLTKRSPPYSVELDLGSLPRTRTLRVVGFDEAGEELASDQLLLNAGGHRFDVRLVEPRRDRRYQDSLQAEVQVSLPDGKSLDRLELFLNEQPVATLFQPPYTLPILLPPGDDMSYVRAVAYLTDGNSTEDVVFVNAPDYLENVDVQFVELYTTVLDRAGRPIKNLQQENFSAQEDGVAQSIVRFDQVAERPFHAGILLDVSASMDDSMDAVKQAAVGFFNETLESKDRATLITFNDRPNLAVKFTNEVGTLAGGLAGLKAERGTALYDSLIFTLYYFNGVRGQKAVLLLSDGKDESSKFTYEDTLEYARRAGVTIYAIGLKDVAKDSGTKRKLTKLAEETGGRSFFVESPAELTAIYAQIQDELRSQYLIAYQSSNTGGEDKFREVELKVDRSGAEVKTLRGYYP